MEAAVALQASVQPLIDKIGGFDQVTVLLDLVEQVGGWDGLKKMVARANATSPSPGNRERQWLDAEAVSGRRRCGKARGLNGSSGVDNIVGRMVAVEDRAVW